MRLALLARAALVGLSALSLSAACVARPAAGTPSPPAPLPEGPETLSDARHGFFIARPGGWTLERTDAGEGVLLTLTSPDGAISVRVVRDVPPPTIDLASYGRAMVDGMRLSQPGLQMTEEETAGALANGLPVYRARFTVAGAVPQAGELEVVLRPREGYEEAYLVQATGPWAAYQAWTPDIRAALDGFFLAAVPLPSLPAPLP